MDKFIIDLRQKDFVDDNMSTEDFLSSVVKQHYNKSWLIRQFCKVCIDVKECYVTVRIKHFFGKSVRSYRISIKVDGETVDCYSFAAYSIDKRLARNYAKFPQVVINTLTFKLI